MSNILKTKAQLVEYILSGQKPKNQHKVGIEFENLLFKLPYYLTLSYEDISKILSSFSTSIWQPEIEGDNLIGLKSSIGSISLEPAGQFELSSIPVKDINEINQIISTYFEELFPILKNNNTALVSMGYNPKFSKEQLPLMPKSRYAFMYNYMPKVGTLGRKMMKGTCTYQVNLDYSNESDLGKKFKVLMALQPLLAILFSNSPIVEGKISKYLSYRNQIWLDTDSRRSGLLPFIFEENFKVEKYVDYAINTPMYFIKRNNEYINAQQILFKDFLSGKAKIGNAEPYLEDFELHLSTLFPDVRLKTYLETRSTDCPDIEYYNSLPALLVGLVYEDSILNSTYDLVKKWSYQDLQTLKINSTTQGLSAKIQNQSIQNISKELLNMATLGLKIRALGEEKYLDPLKNLVEKNLTMAQNKVAIFNNSDTIDSFLNKIALIN